MNVYRTAQQILEQEKSLRMRQLTQDCSEVVMVGKSFSTTDTNQGTVSIHIAGGKEIAVLLQNKARACLDSGVNFTVSDAVSNEVFTLEPQVAVDFSNEVMLWGSSQWEKKKNLQNDVMYAPTIEDVCAITWDSL